MQRLVVLLIKVTHTFARFLGLMPYVYDYKERRVSTKNGVTISCILANIFILANIVVLYQSALISEMKARAQDLHQYVYIVVMMVRVVAVVLTLGLNWQRRQRFISTIIAFLELRRKYFWHLPMRQATLRNFESRIVKKFFWGLLAALSLWSVSMLGLDSASTMLLKLSMCSLQLLTQVLNMVICLYFFGVLNVSLHFHILNDELQRILRAANTAQLKLHDQELKQRRFTGNFITKCCQLTDDLDELALVYKELQELAIRINNMFDIQGMCVIINLYLNNISIIYMCYTMTKWPPEAIRLNAVPLVLIAISFGSYYWDLNIFTNGMLHVLEVRAESEALLQQYTPLGLLDVRLEKSLQHFCLQLALNPLEYNMMGLFKFTKPLSFSVFVSTVLHSIILMQIDYKQSSLK